MNPHAMQLEMHPERIRAARTKAGVDSMATSWVENVTLPSLAVPLVRSGATQMVNALSPAAATEAAAASSISRTLPGIITLCTLPVLMPLGSRAAEAISAWAFRPATQFLHQRMSE
jgi:hypothetical protein